LFIEADAQTLRPLPPTYPHMAGGIALAVPTSAAQRVNM